LRRWWAPGPTRSSRCLPSPASLTPAPASAPALLGQDPPCRLLLPARGTSAPLAAGPQLARPGPGGPPWMKGSRQSVHEHQHQHQHHPALALASPHPHPHLGLGLGLGACPGHETRSRGRQLGGSRRCTWTTWRRRCGPASSRRSTTVPPPYTLHARPAAGASLPTRTCPRTHPPRLCPYLPLACCHRCLPRSVPLPLMCVGGLSSRSASVPSSRPPAGPGTRGHPSSRRTTRARSVAHGGRGACCRQGV
jgi:hypothetical protein